MKLDDYLIENKLTSREFAEIVDASQPQIHKLRKGTVGVSLQLAARIEKATGGRVTMKDFVDVQPEKRAR